MRISVLPAVAGLLLSPCLWAANVPGNTFLDIDGDGDGLISEAEAAAVPGLRKTFGDLDANQDNHLDALEFKQYDPTEGRVLEQSPPPPAAGLLIRARQMLDLEVVDVKGEPLGQIKDLVLDMRQHRIIYVVVETDGLLGLGSKLVALPPEAVLVGTGGVGEGHGRYALQLNMTEEQLDEARGFEDHTWPAGPETEIIEHTRQGQEYD